MVSNLVSSHFTKVKTDTVAVMHISLYKLQYDALCIFFAVYVLGKMQDKFALT